MKIYPIKTDHTVQAEVKKMILVKRSLWDTRFNPCEVRFTIHLSDSSLLDVFATSNLLCIVIVAKFLISSFSHLAISTARLIK